MSIEEDVKVLIAQLDSDIDAVRVKIKELKVVSNYLLEQVTSGSSQVSTRFENVHATKAAEIVLYEAGTPLSMAQIVTLVLNGGYDSTGEKIRASLYTAFGRQKKKFLKVSPGVFILVTGSNS